MDPVVSVENTNHNFLGTLDHRPEIRAAWDNLDEVFVGDSATLPFKLKENVRRSLAADLGCKFCNSFGSTVEADDTAESLAIAFVAQVLEDHKNLDPTLFDALRTEFSDEQIVELVAWICFKVGANMFGSIMRLEAANEQQLADAERYFADHGMASDVPTKGE